MRTTRICLAIVALILAGCGPSQDYFYHLFTRPGVVEAREWKITTRSGGLISGKAELTSAQVRELVRGLPVVETSPGRYQTDDQTSASGNQTVTLAYPVPGLDQDTVDEEVLSDPQKRPATASIEDHGGI